MRIVVDPHSQQEEQQLLDFLNSMKYDYKQESESGILSVAQEQEILARDEEFEAGETESYSLDEIVAYFNIKGK